MMYVDILYYIIWYCIFVLLYINLHISKFESLVVLLSISTNSIVLFELKSVRFDIENSSEEYKFILLDSILLLQILGDIVSITILFVELLMDRISFFCFIKSLYSCLNPIIDNNKY